MPTDPTFHYPPLIHHTSLPLPPSSAATPLSAYLEKSLTRPYLHPDAWLSLEGVRHGPKSGPQGSWALHHLRRIEAGMRGEVLEVESTEELVGRFGEEVVDEAMGRRFAGRRREDGEEVVGEVETGYGAEENVREQVAAAPKPKPKKVVQAEKPEHLMTKAEKKKARRAAEKAEIARARELGEEVPTFGKKRKRGGGEQSEASQSEAGGNQSQAGGYDDDDDDEAHNNTTTTKTADINDPQNYQSSRSYSLSQKPLLEDFPDRDPAGVDREDAVAAPVVVQHDSSGSVVVPSQDKKQKKRKGSTTAYEATEEKEARRAAKKARREEGKRGKDVDVSMRDVGDLEVEAAVTITPRKKDVGRGDGTASGLSRSQRKKSKEEGGMGGTPTAANGIKDVQMIGAPVATAAASGEKKAAKKKSKKVKVKKEKEEVSP